MSEQFIQSSMLALNTLDNSKMLRGSVSASNASLGRWDPSMTGYSHIFLLQGPKVLGENLKSIYAGTTKDRSAEAARHGKNFKTLINFGSTAYSGTPDLTLNTTELNIGNITGGIPVPTYAQFDGNQFSIKMMETRGEPLRRLLEFWITAISDPKAPHSHAHGLMPAGAAAPFEPKLENITAEILVVQTDQTLRNIQNYDLWQCCYPTTVGRSDLDWDSGSIEAVQPKDVQFKGIYVPAPADLEDTVITLMNARRSRWLAYYNVRTNQNVGTEPTYTAEGGYSSK